MWGRIWSVLKAIGLGVAWIVGLFFGLTWFLHGINGYPKCAGVGPGGSCSFSSARGTKRVAYEDLEKVDLFSLALGSLTLLILASSLWMVVARTITWWKARGSSMPEGAPDR